nr:hypothetical protein [uncultured Desulfobulbus sp.]
MSQKGSSKDFLIVFQTSAEHVRQLLKMLEPDTLHDFLTVQQESHSFARPREPEMGATCIWFK